MDEDTPTTKHEYTQFDRIVDEVMLEYLDDLAERLEDIAWACRGDWGDNEQY